MTEQIAATTEPIRAATLTPFPIAVGRIVTGRSPTPLLTAFAAGIVGKLSMVALAMPIYWYWGAAGSTNFSGRFHGIDGADIFLAVAFAPLLESLIVWLIVWFLLKKLKLPLSITALGCGAINVALHGIAPMSLSVFPVFALYALILANWSNRGRSGTGYWSISGAHAVQNAISVLLALMLN